MASPQKENGFTPIANELLEKLAFAYFRPSQTKILFALLRKTYGWNKSEDSISLSQFSIQTGLKRPHVCRAINELCHMNIVTKIGNGYITKYKLQKDFDKWKSLPISVKVLPNSVIGVTNIGNKVLPNSAHTKDIKDNIQKKEDFFFLKDELFKKTFADFLDMRVKIKKPATEQAKKLILKDLHKVDIKTAIKMLEKSIVSCWRDVFPLKDQLTIQTHSSITNARKPDQFKEKMDSWREEAAPMPEDCREALKKIGLVK